MRHSLVKLFALIIIVLPLASCLRPIRPGEHGFKTDFVKGQVYATTTELILYIEKSRQNSATDAGAFLENDASSLEEIRSGKYPQEHVLGAGTRIQCVEFMFCDCVDGTNMHVNGKILNGPYAGMYVILPAKHGLGIEWTNVYVDETALTPLR